jgi:hypothetical protein
MRSGETFAFALAFLSVIPGENLLLLFPQDPTIPSPFMSHPHRDMSEFAHLVPPSC